MKDEILFTPPLRANLLIANFVIPSVTGLVDFLLFLFPPVFPVIFALNPFPVIEFYY